MYVFSLQEIINIDKQNIKIKKAKIFPKFYKIFGVAGKIRLMCGDRNFFEWSRCILFFSLIFRNIKKKKMKKMKKMFLNKNVYYIKFLHEFNN